MVYRGKPSAGCENCRKAKKRCGLERPECLRCVKLKKTCSGYRDVTQLQIQDESESVRFKAEQKKNKSTHLLPPPQPAKTDTLAGIATPGSTSSDSSSGNDSNDSTIDPLLYDAVRLSDEELDDLMSSDFFDLVPYRASPPITDLAVPSLLIPSPEDIAQSYFFRSFTTTGGHWDFLRTLASTRQLDPCLDLATRAVGMAAMGNVQTIPMGRQHARRWYAQALGLLNTALRDPQRCRTDESLVAVAMLGFYENVSCESRESLRSWKTHIDGASQLLQLRGKEQFQTKIGRIMFREMRSMVMVRSMWDDQDPPTYLRDWQEELTAQDPNTSPIPGFADVLVSIMYDFAIARSSVQRKKITPLEGMAGLAEIEQRFIQWEAEALTTKSKVWGYYELDVPESPHVWNGMVHNFAGLPAPQIWNQMYGMRILLSRTQESLCGRIGLSDIERQAQMQYHRNVRRRTTDCICATIPACLGHAAPAFNSPCVLMTAYTSVWPLFFAATAALERMELPPVPVGQGQRLATPAYTTSLPTAQGLWILKRLEYVARNVGVRSAEGVCATLRGDFKIHNENLIPNNARIPKWAKDVEKQHRGPRMLLEEETPQSKALARNEPIWLGKAIGEAAKDPNKWSWHHSPNDFYVEPV